jgi:hypothetical protein
MIRREIARFSGCSGAFAAPRNRRGTEMSYWNAVLLLLSVVVGATMQYWLSRSAESQKQIQLLHSPSYVDYLRAVTRAAHASSPEAVHLAQAQAADAKARMAVYAPSGVIAALARFEEAGAILDNPRTRGAFVALVSAMRQKRGKAQADDLSLVLFGQQRGTEKQN